MDPNPGLGLFPGNPNDVDGGLRAMLDPHTIVRPQPTPVKPFTLSHLDPGMLTHRVEPVYPHIAIVTKQEGTVVLQAVIGTNGRISELHALQGPALLIDSAKSAVSQWRYKPYILNGQAVPVQTEIRVNFTLQR